MAHGNTITRFVYKHSPWVLQTLFASYYGFSKSFRRFGNHYQEYYDYLTKSQWFTSEQLKQLEVEELKRIIAHTANNVPYYTEVFQKLKLSPDDINSVEDLTKLPILTKEEVRVNCERLRAKNCRRRDIIIDHTSGTTGKALELAFSKESYQKEQALVWFHRSWGGVKYKDKTATFAGHMVVDIDRKKPPFWVNNLYEKQVIFSSYHMTKDNLKYYAQKLLRFQPQLIWGYPSSIYLMAIFLEKEDITEIKPKAVFTSSETLLDFQREKIEKTFQTKVFNYYGNSEMVPKILECEKGGLHVQRQFGIVEFLDGNNQPVGYGQEGKMVCTGLCNYAMPLIRYDIADVAIPVDNECTCGRQGPLVEKIVGRVDDYIVTRDGRLIGRLGHIFKETKNVEEAQIIQEDRNTLLLKIVRRPEYSDRDTQKIISRTENRVGHEMRIKVEFVDNIPKLPNGKFRFVISKVPFEL